MRSLFVLCLGLAVCLNAFVLADDERVGDAEELKNEATAIIKAHSTKPVSPKEYAMAVYRLEKAQSLLEAAGDANSALAQEVNSSLFWARRCSNVHIIKELDKIHAENPPLKLASKDPAKKKEKAEGAPDEIDTQADARNAFNAAQEFAKLKANDDYAVSLRYFQMANEHPGTDYAMKAMSLSRDHLMKHTMKSGSAKEEIPDTDEMKPLKAADALVEQGKIEQSFDLYKESIKLKDTVIAHRKLGLAYFQRAQQMKDDINPRFEALNVEYKEAYAASWVQIGHGKSSPKQFNPNNPKWVAVKKKHQDLIGEANQAMVRYLYAQWEFEKILKMSPNNRDFDAAAFTGIALSARPDMKGRAQQYLKKFLSDYEPTNDLERLVYEYCKTESDRVSAR
jgi:hypothetical protein